MRTDIGDRLIDTFFAQSDIVREICNSDGMSDNEKVHELRRIFKRLRALLRLFNDVPEGLAVQQGYEIRNFGKILAPLRESAVNLSFFKNHAADLLPEDKYSFVIEYMSSKNKYLIQQVFLDNRLNGTIEKYFDDFKATYLKRKQNLPVEQHVFREIAYTYKVCFTLYQIMPVKAHPEEWHELRKKLKRLGYQLDFILFLDSEFPVLKTEQLNKLTELLGEDHDLYVFSEDIISSGYEMDSQSFDILIDHVNHLQKKNFRKLENQLVLFFNESPLNFHNNLAQLFNLEL